MSEKLLLYVYPDSRGAVFIFLFDIIAVDGAYVGGTARVFNESYERDAWRVPHALGEE